MINSGKNIHPIDLHVGSRVRTLRAQRGLTQTDLASQLGLSFQQLQKYETGTNRISASKLYTIAKALGVGPGYFFEGLDDDSSGSEAVELDLEAARIAALISKVSNREARACLRDLIKLIIPREDVELPSRIRAL